MPYIKDVRRKELLEPSVLRQPHEPNNAGELNFIITSAVVHFLGYGKPSYQRYNEVIGVLECAKLELYRRMVAPYEDIKIKENGDVY